MSVETPTVAGMAKWAGSDQTSPAPTSCADQDSPRHFPIDPADPLDSIMTIVHGYHARMDALDEAGRRLAWSVGDLLSRERARGTYRSDHELHMLMKAEEALRAYQEATALP